MKTVHVTLVVLNLAEVAVCHGGLLCEEASRGVGLALVELLKRTGLTSYGQPKLSSVHDGPAGIEIVYRVRTRSRMLSTWHEWQHVDARLSDHDRMVLEQALENERP